MKNKLFILLVLFGITACTSIKKEEQAITKIIFSETSSSLNQSNLLENKKYVQLETTDECLFSEITQFSCTSKELFIFDIYTQSVYVFDYTGKFLRKIHKTGQGPGEYSMITSMLIDEESNLISLVDLGQKILSYNLNSFVFIDDIHIETTSIEKADKDNFVSYNSLSTHIGNKDYKYHVLTCNKNGQIEQKFLPIEFESGYTMRPIHRFYRSEGELFIYLPFTSDIYKITPDSCFRYYDVKYENLSFPSLEYLKSIDKQGDNYIKKLYTDNYVYSVQIFENKKFVTSQFSVGERRYIGIYDKDKKEGYYYLKTEKNSPKSIEKVDYLQIIGTNKENFISVLKLDTDCKTEYMDNELQQIISRRAEENNPILLFFNLKSSQ